MNNTNVYAKQTVYDFKFDALLSKNPIELSAYKGSVILIVNTASKCGFTAQYKGLEELYQNYKNQGLVVIGVPSNDFGSQEFYSSLEIANFCDLNYGVTFPMTSILRVKGSNAHPFYTWAKNALGFGTAPKWNFHKYVINRQGQLVDYFHSTTTPLNKRLIKAIEKLLDAK